ncbi:hypothetical protein Tco_1068213 [Tanacetum coccineum]|uniref:Reverse transcriptase domain-containing protein n=1 Tax=Tanacetum coccineum TaxID=301880 RepID=A0ABQ5HF83_9ASTR
MFHPRLLNLKKCLSDESLIIPLEEIQVDDKLYFIEEPVEIMDREIKQFKESRILIVKVAADVGDDTIKATNALSFVVLFIGKGSKKKDGSDGDGEVYREGLKLRASLVASILNMILKTMSNAFNTGNMYREYSKECHYRIGLLPSVSLASF